MVSSRKKQKISAVDHSDDVQALGSQSSRNRKQKQPTQEELDLTASLFGSAGASLRSDKARRQELKEGETDTAKEHGLDSGPYDEETGLDDLEDDQVSGRLRIPTTVIAHPRSRPLHSLLTAVCH